MSTYFYYHSPLNGKARFSDSKPDDVNDFVIVKKLDLFVMPVAFEIICFKGGVPKDDLHAYIQTNRLAEIIETAEDMLKGDDDSGTEPVQPSGDGGSEKLSVLETESSFHDAVIRSGPQERPKPRKSYTEAQKLAILMDTELGIHSNISKEILSGLLRRKITSRNELSEKEINLVKRLIRHLQKELGDNKRVVDFLLYASSQQVHNVFSRDGFTKLFDAFNSTVAQDELPF